MMRLTSLALLIALSGAAPALAGARAGLDVFKGLAGTWSIQSGGKPLPIVITYAVGSKGSIVTEAFGQELTVIHRDGDALVMTHFCNAGNQPRLRLHPSAEAGIYRFEMYDITSLKTPDDPHVQRITYRMIGKDRVNLRIVWRRGASEDEEAYTLRRQ